MDCNATRRLLAAALDGELDLIRQLEVEAHLNDCPECARLNETLLARKLALRHGLPRFGAPAQLAGKVLAALQAERAPAGAGTPPKSQARFAPLVWPVWKAAGLAASVAFALAIGYAWGGERARGNLLIGEAVSGHIRSLQFNHLSDVISTDQHTVKPWFAGKLDFAPPVVDLTAAGFPLTGGRLEHLDGRPAAALVFRRRQHAINLFVWPAARQAVAVRRSELNGYQTQSWTQGGFNFLAVSEIPAAELSQFATAFQSATSG